MHYQSNDTRGDCDQLVSATSTGVWWTVPISFLTQMVNQHCCCRLSQPNPRVNTADARAEEAATATSGRHVSKVLRPALTGCILVMMESWEQLRSQVPWGESHKTLSVMTTCFTESVFDTSHNMAVWDGAIAKAVFNYCINSRVHPLERSNCKYWVQCVLYELHSNSS